VENYNTGKFCLERRNMSCENLKVGQIVDYDGRKKVVAEIRRGSAGHHEVGVYDLGEDGGKQFWSYFSDRNGDVFLPIEQLKK